MRLIGLTGKAGVGKDTVADYLIWNCNFSKIAFAEPIRMMSAMLGADIPRTREEKESLHPVFGVSWRKIWQTLGTEWMREQIHPDGWIMLMEHKIKGWRELCPDHSIVIPDVRFENEAKWIREQGGTIWHIIRDVPAVREHSSENGIKFGPGDYLLENSGTIDELQGNIEWLLND